MRGEKRPAPIDASQMVNDSVRYGEPVRRRGTTPNFVQDSLTGQLADERRRQTKDLGVALARMRAVSSISIMNVELERTMSSRAPMRVKMASTMPMRA